jgi:hypothetical protein
MLAMTMKAEREATASPDAHRALEVVRRIGSSSTGGAAMLTVAGKSSGRAHAETLMVTNYAPEVSCYRSARATLTGDSAMAQAETSGSFMN